MSIKNLFYSSYWFDQPYIARGWVMWVWILSFFALILFGIVLLFVRHFKEEKFTRMLLSKYASTGITFGLLGLLWFFFRQERVVFLAWRFWFFFWVFGLGLWILNLTRYMLHRLPVVKEEQRTRAMKQKYLPAKN